MLPTELLADIVLIIHFGIALFVVGGLVLIVIGNLLNWAWVNSLWLRLLHLFAIAIVIAEAWVGIVCPLTALEAWLRSLSGAPFYSESFIAYWIQRVLFYEAPAWVFTCAYTVFGLLVVAVWCYFPPSRRKLHK